MRWDRGAESTHGVLIPPGAAARLTALEGCENWGSFRTRRQSPCVITTSAKLFPARGAAEATGDANTNQLRLLPTGGGNKLTRIGQQATF